MPSEEIEPGQGAPTNSSYSVIVYPAKELPMDYVPLIFARWLRSFRFGNPYLRKSDAGDYYRHYHKYIEMLLSKPDTMVRLAVLSDDHDIVLGFSVAREDVLDYVHVQANHRRQGIAKKLIPPGITTVSHATELAKGILWRGEKYKHIKLNPFA